MKQPRSYTGEFKLEVGRQLDSGEQRVAQLCREHQIDESTVRRWRQEVAQRGPAAFSPDPAGATEGLERRIAELERVCGQLAMENAMLKRGEHLAAWRT
jgi:transposase-like protein